MESCGRSDSPKPGQYICCQDSNPRPGRYTGEGFLRARFSMGELVAANHDRNQARDLGYRAGEKVLHCGEAGIER